MLLLFADETCACRKFTPSRVNSCATGVRRFYDYTRMKNSASIRDFPIPQRSQHFNLHVAMEILDSAVCNLPPQSAIFIDRKFRGLCRDRLLNRVCMWTHRLALKDWRCWLCASDLCVRCFLLRFALRSWALYAAHAIDRTAIDRRLAHSRSSGQFVLRSFVAKIA